MRFAYAKVGKGNSELDEYLAAEKKFIPIYFNGAYSSEEEFLRYGGSKEQGKLFFEFGREPAEKFIVVNASSEIRIYRPMGRVVFRKRRWDQVDGWVKLLPVQHVVSVPIRRVPAVLAGINANRYYSSGTFREIKSAGNVAALRYLIGAPVGEKEFGSLGVALNLLGSVELETLVARVLDERGLFVPAHHGGTMQDADLFAHNDSDEAVAISTLQIPPRESISIQVKRSSNFRRKPEGIDYVICVEGSPQDWQLTQIWLAEALQSSPITSKWLRRSLAWAAPACLDADHGRVGAS